MAVPLFRAKNLQGCWSYIRLGIPGAAIVIIDWGAYEVLSLWSNAFGVQTQTSLILVLNFLNVCYQIQYAFQIVSCSYVGK